jgi:hypothetical protein
MEKKYFKIGTIWGTGGGDFYDVMKENNVVITVKGTDTGLKVDDIAAIAKGGHLEFTDVVIIGSNRQDLEVNSELYEKFGAVDSDIPDSVYCYSVKEWIHLDNPISYGGYQGMFNIQDQGVKQQIESRIREYNQNKLENRVKELLLASKNLILTGAPGTGKTFLAGEIAKSMGAVGKFVQFHPSYDYTDFVEGLRPTSSGGDGKIGFELRDGIFKEFCRTAVEQQHPNDKENPPFVFIIDEINRGEISKIFGELFFSIDPGYRGKKDWKVQTQYANMIEIKNDNDDVFKDGFYVPENVYIIGTMNDIDRSVESFDFAMRRRFTWVEIKAADRVESMGLSPKSQDKMNALNGVIETIEGLGSSYHIGAAYFLKLKNDDYKQLWDYHLLPLLKEYLRGMPKATVDEYLKEENGKFSGKLVEAYENN